MQGEVPLTPALGEFSRQTVITLNLHNVVKIIALHRKLHDLSRERPDDDAIQTRLSAVNRWVGSVLQQYDNLSKESRQVVDMFVELWGWKGETTSPFQRLAPAQSMDDIGGQDFCTQQLPTA